MKKILNWILSVIGFFLLIALMVISLGETLNFIKPNWQDFVNIIKNYGAVTLVGALVLVNIIGKSIIRIILTIIFLTVLVFYIFATAFPTEFIRIFGGA